VESPLLLRGTFILSKFEPMNYMRFTVLILIFLFTSVQGFTQIKAVLVKLYAEKNRSAYLKRNGMSEDLAELRKDVKATMKVTIADFEDNFSGYPVYYFIDTNLQSVKNGDFEGVLLDANLKPLPNVNLKKGDNYRIVYYGIPGHEVSLADSVYMDRKYPGDGLVVLGPDYKPVKRSSHFVYQNQLFSKADKRYIYNSKRFGIGYRPFARFLVKAL
jgi:hypothetical protein